MVARQLLEHPNPFTHPQCLMSHTSKAYSTAAWPGLTMGSLQTLQRLCSQCARLECRLASVWYAILTSGPSVTGSDSLPSLS